MLAPASPKLASCSPCQAPPVPVAGQGTAWQAPRQQRPWAASGHDQHQSFPKGPDPHTQHGPGHPGLDQACSAPAPALSTMPASAHHPCKAGHVDHGAYVTARGSCLHPWDGAVSSPAAHRGGNQAASLSRAAPCPLGTQGLLSPLEPPGETSDPPHPRASRTPQPSPLATSPQSIPTFPQGPHPRPGDAHCTKPLPGTGACSECPSPGCP